MLIISGGQLWDQWMGMFSPHVYRWVPDAGYAHITQNTHTHGRIFPILSCMYTSCTEYNYNNHIPSYHFLSPCAPRSPEPFHMYQTRMRGHWRVPCRDDASWGRSVQEEIPATRSSQTTDPAGRPLTDRSQRYLWHIVVPSPLPKPYSSRLWYRNPVWAIIGETVNAWKIIW